MDSAKTFHMTEEEAEIELLETLKKDPIVLESNVKMCTVCEIGEVQDYYRFVLANKFMFASIHFQTLQVPRQ